MALDDDEANDSSKPEAAEDEERPGAATRKRRLSPSSDSEESSSQEVKDAPSTSVFRKEKCPSICAPLYANKTPRFRTSHRTSTKASTKAKFDWNDDAEKAEEESKSDPADLKCPICLHYYDSPVSAECGHTFCYECISESLQTRKQCPICGEAIEDALKNTEPNEETAERVSEEMQSMSDDELKAAIDEQKQRPRQVCDMLLQNQKSLSLSQVRFLLETLDRRKDYLLTRQEHAHKVLCLEFLERLREEKKREQEETESVLACIERDILSTKRWVGSASPAAASPSGNAKEVPPGADDTSDDAAQSTSSDAGGGATYIASTVPNCEASVAEISGFIMDEDVAYETSDATDKVDIDVLQRELKPVLESRLNKMKKDFNALKEVYFEHQTKLRGEPALRTFARNLASFSEFTQLQSRASFLFPEPSSQSTIVSSVEFDKDYQYFAVAGVCKKIKLYEFNGVPLLDSRLYFPVVEMNCTSKISSIAWNDHLKHLLASADYEGGVQVWDAYEGRTIRGYKEHSKRVWSVDYNHVDPKLLASGSDDTKVRLWSTDSEKSINTLESKANVCCVQFSPKCRNLLAFGSADHSVTMYDLRNTVKPLFVCKNHRKAVAYVKYASRDEFVSASTDSHVRLWQFGSNLGSSNRSDSVVTPWSSEASVGTDAATTDGDSGGNGASDPPAAASATGNNATTGTSTPVKPAPCEAQCLRTFGGHVNEKNFVGLDCDGDYIASGSENNTLYVYHREVGRPVLTYKFTPTNDQLTRSMTKADGTEFLSAVAWKKGSNVIVAANSQGLVQILEMV